MKREAEIEKEAVEREKDALERKTEREGDRKRERDILKVYRKKKES
jgi:hypothetical protein